MAQAESGVDGPKAGAPGYVIGQDNVSGRIYRYGFDIHNPVFLISAGAIVLFVLVALAFPSQAASVFGWLRAALTRIFDGFFIVAANLFVLFCLLLMAPLGAASRSAAPTPLPNSVLALGLPCCSRPGWASA